MNIGIIGVGTIGIGITGPTGTGSGINTGIKGNTGPTCIQSPTRLTMFNNYSFDYVTLSLT